MQVKAENQATASVTTRFQEDLSALQVEVSKLSSSRLEGEEEMLEVALSVQALAEEAAAREARLDEMQVDVKDKINGQVEENRQNVEDLKLRVNHWAKSFLKVRAKM